MDIFENLIGELKNENLLEETVIKTGSKEDKPIILQEDLKDEEDFKDEAVVVDEAAEDCELIIIEDAQLVDEATLASAEEPETMSLETSGDSLLNQPEFAPNQAAPVTSGIEFETNRFETNQVATNVSSTDEAEFYRKRATDEVSFLQVVEHVFAGLEREQMKIVPKSFDALAVKKILHNFLQMSKQSNSNEQTQAEFQLLQETENWFSALTQRDKRISINHLRRYCECARPSLSSPALVALARFYRNSPYSEQARGKFDFIVTRLFSKDVENERREMVFSHDELILHLKELYAEWSSIPLYSMNEDDSEILLIALKFEDFITEAAIAGSFDELINNDFFNRLRLFKKSTNENFFAPLVVAASVDSNIKIGNRYVELLEKEKANKSIFEDKYGFLHDQTISDATGKTFQLVELLSRKIEKPKTAELKQTPIPVVKKEKKAANETKTVKTVKDVNQKTTSTPKTTGEKAKPEINQLKTEKKSEIKSSPGNNSWVLTAVIFAIIVSVGLFIWSNNSNSKAKELTGGKTVNLENSSLKESLQKASISDETFSAVVKPSWNNLAQPKKEEILKKIISIGEDKGFKKVLLQNNEGKTVGIASPEKVEVYVP